MWKSTLRARCAFWLALSFLLLMVTVGCVAGLLKCLVQLVATGGPNSSVTWALGLIVVGEWAARIAKFSLDRAERISGNS